MRRVSARSSVVCALVLFLAACGDDAGGERIRLHTVTSTKSRGDGPTQRSVTYEFTIPKDCWIEQPTGSFLIDSAGRKHRFLHGSLSMSNRGAWNQKQRFSATFEVPEDYEAATLHIESCVVDLQQSRIRRVGGGR